MADSLTAPKTKKQKANWTLTIVLLLLIAITLMAILAAKKYFEVGRAIDPNELRIKELTEAVNDNPKDALARAALAYSFQANKQYDEAREQYEEVLKVEPGNNAAMYNLAVIAEETQDNKLAEKLYKELLQKAPDHVLGNLGLSQVYVNTKRYDEAIKIVDSLMKYSAARDKVEFHLVKGKAYEMKGNKVKAREAYQKVLQFIPDHEEAKEAIARLK